MNKIDAKDYLPLVQALAEGKTLQWLNNGNGNWQDQQSVSFSYSPNCYRIKPEPKKAWFRVALIKNKDGCIFTSTADSTDVYKDPEKALVEEWGRNFIEWITDRIEYKLPE